MPRICTIGGGTGSPTIIKALLESGYSHLSAISASMDSGGKTGQVRTDERDRIIAISDLLRNLLALISTPQNHLKQVAAFSEIAGFTDGRNRNLGYTIYYALLEKYSGNFLAVQNTLEKLLDIRFQGQAIPVTLQSANICFSTELGTTFTGEHELDRQSMSSNQITKIWLDNPVSATPEAISAITNATHIIYSPGSIYGSVLVNFLPKGITAALKKTRAKKILIANLVSNRNQTHQITPLGYFKLFQKYTHLSKPFDYFICPDISTAEFENLYPNIASTYASEHSYFLGWSEDQLSKLKKLAVCPVPADILSITPQLNRIRHDSKKLARTLKLLISP